MHEDEESRVLCPLRDEVEAEALREMLKQRGITAAVTPMSDTAYPGVFNRGKPWGVMRVRSGDFSLAQWLLNDFRRAEIIEEPRASMSAPAPEQAPPPRQGGLSPISWLVLAVSIGLFVGLRHCSDERGNAEKPRDARERADGPLRNWTWGLS